ncbi:2-oxoacid dehydrogenases acyltransferase-domain-containing protein [Dunaliella salina]|uniref:Dihydrolipoamide acetyltransferase component of pyruvate dehydrogenase complex n=1 Tax=Dunaliella salina TaxID=3046 RepID=A0ABQ7GID1_DUNSA|nr:2-oxoacid dehydrogenases acyltransferase-domain-containing protein [Dunaliella salina]|eukprot:KAF5834358.1 2-oxoacid dehydrogenases acyltransferase-domain-containing protein [Dunaliella salina]
MMKFSSFGGSCALLHFHTRLRGILSRECHCRSLITHPWASYAPDLKKQGPVFAGVSHLVAAAPQPLPQCHFLCTARDTSEDHSKAPATPIDNDVMGEPEGMTPGGSKLISFPLAQTGEGIAECELVQWACKEGDIVGEFDKLCVVQSDKASVEITSPYAGIIRHLQYKEGDIVKVGASLLDVEVPADAGWQEPLAAGHSLGEPTPEHIQAQLQPSEAASTATAKTATAGVDRLAHAFDLEGNVASKATPAVRQLARELGIDLARTSLEGTGPDGRILAGDVFRAASVAPPPPAPSPLPASLPMPESVPSIIPVRGYRRAMIKSMTAAAQIPVFHLHDEVCLDELMRVRRVLQGDPVMGTSKLTLLPFMLKALSTILSFPQHALLNSSLSLPDGQSGNGSSGDGAGQSGRLQETAIHVHSDHNIGVAMATVHGLVVPNIKQVQCKTVPQIARELLSLQAAAAEAKLKPQDLQGGTITISNIGAVGGMFANPLVSPPETVILAMGRMRMVPRYMDPNAAVSPSDSLKRSLSGQRMGASSGLGRNISHGGIQPEQQALYTGATQMQWRSSLGVSWGADHRVVDGAGLALASNAWKALLEEPARMLLSLR